MNEIQTNEPDANQLFRWRFTECFGTLTPEEVLAASKAAADEIDRLRARNADLRRIIGEWSADPIKTVKATPVVDDPDCQW